MNSKLIIILFLGNLVGLYLFLNGFLMNRSEIFIKSNCTNNSCIKPKYSRIIILLVDALKYEFLDVYDKQNTMASEMTYISKALKMNKAGVYHFKSDPPTTTLQRIKGLTTGSLPTFIDISSNFGGDKLMEDNLLYQWKTNNYKIKFVGDDTWTRLFPNIFEESSQGYPSFNVKDLDTVDTAVVKYLKNILPERPDSNEIIIGHMLGIDHCGHTYGKNHSEMKRKLKELNQLISFINEYIDESTYFIMMGDHGMTDNGDHGGDSFNETDSGLFVMSQNNVISSENKYGKTISQIDLVPFLSAITRVPIPFSNLGILPKCLFSKNSELYNIYEKENYIQIKNFVNSYRKLYPRLDLPKSLIDFLENSEGTDLTKNLLAIQHFFRSKWAKFNTSLIYCGLLTSIFFISQIALHFLTNNSFSLNKLCWIASLTVLNGFIMNGHFLLNLVTLSYIIVDSCYCLLQLKDLSINLFNQFITVILMVNFALSFSNSFIVSHDKILQFLLQTLVFGRVIFSFKIFINKKLHKITSSRKNKAIVKTLFDRISKLLTKRSLVIILLYVMGSILLKLALFYRLCREEQSGFCKMLPDNSSVYWPVSLMPLLYIVSYFLLRSFGNFTDKSNLRQSVFKLFYSVGILCYLVYESFLYAASKDLSPAQKVAVDKAVLYLPRAIWLISGCNLVLLISCESFLMDIVTSSTKSHRSNNVIVNLFHKLKQQQTGYEPESIVVQGLASILLSKYVCLLLTSMLILATFIHAQYVLGMVTILGFLVVYSLIVANSTVNFNDTENPLNQFSVYELSCLISLLIQFSFYSNGHQTTLSNIPWPAAFVGHQGDHSNNLVPLVKILFNLFGGSVVMLCCFGLVIPVFITTGLVFSPANPFSVTNSNHLGDFRLVQQSDYSIKLLTDWFKKYLAVLLLMQSFNNLSTLWSCAIHRRHLMAWKIFVPFMLYNTVQLLICYLSCIAAFYLLKRILHNISCWLQNNL